MTTLEMIYMSVLGVAGVCAFAMFAHVAAPKLWKAACEQLSKLNSGF